MDSDCPVDETVSGGGLKASERSSSTGKNGLVTQRSCFFINLHRVRSKKKTINTARTNPVRFVERHEGRTRVSGYHVNIV